MGPPFFSLQKHTVELDPFDDATLPNQGDPASEKAKAAAKMKRLRAKTLEQVSEARCI